MTLQDAFEPAYQKQKEDVMRNTWGHLAPIKGKQYKGYIIFTWASDGTLCPIDYGFKGLDGSPWLYDAIIDFIDDNREPQCKVQRWDGVFKNYKFIGIIRIVNTDLDLA